MSKHHRTAGVDHRVVEIAGQKYTLRPLTVGVYASMESFIASRRPDPLAIASEAVKRLPASQHDAIWRAAMSQAVQARTVTADEASAFENSVDGLAWKVWQCLASDHPEIDSLESAKALLLKAGEEKFEELARAAEIASGEADLKKSTGQAEVEATEAPAGQ
jgi:hypothetical protein